LVLKLQEARVVSGVCILSGCKDFLSFTYASFTYKHACRTLFLLMKQIFMRSIQKVILLVTYYCEKSWLYYYSLKK